MSNDVKAAFDELDRRAEWQGVSANVGPSTASLYSS